MTPEVHAESPAAPRFRSFTWQLTIRLALLVTITSVIVLVAGGLLLARQAAHSLDALHEAEFVEFRKIVEAHPALNLAEMADSIRREADSDIGLYYIQVQRASGEIVFRSENLGTLVLPDLGPEERHVTMSLPGLGAMRMSEDRDDDWHIQVASPLSPFYHVLEDYTTVSVALLCMVALASVALGWGFARLTLRPVRAIRETAGRIRGDNLGERIPVPAGRDELSALTVLLNQMFDRLEAAFNQSRRFTADASHELKTPLSLIRLNAEKLRPRLAEDADGSAALDDLLESVARMQRIVESLLFLAKAETGTLALRLEQIATTTLIGEFSEDAVALAEDRGVRFEVQANEAATVRCEPTLVRQLLLNLVNNAVRVSPPGGHVRLESRVRNGQWSLRVTDEGPGLPEEQLERIFERFVRYAMPAPAGSRSPFDGESSGHGLGLAICRGIAELHGGSIAAGNRTDRSGFSVEASWPVDGPSTFHP
jgi:signal transduction histidine kinase